MATSQVRLHFFIDIKSYSIGMYWYWYISKTICEGTKSTVLLLYYTIFYTFQRIRVDYLTSHNLGSFMCIYLFKSALNIFDNIKLLQSTREAGKEASDSNHLKVCSYKGLAALGSLLSPPIHCKRWTKQIIRGREDWKPTPTPLPSRRWTNLQAGLTHCPYLKSRHICRVSSNCKESN